MLHFTVVHKKKTVALKFLHLRLYVCLPIMTLCTQQLHLPTKISFCILIDKKTYKLNAA